LASATIPDIVELVVFTDESKYSFVPPPSGTVVTQV